MKKTILLFATLTLSLSAYAETMKIASWNIAWLGSHNFNERTSNDYAALAKYAKELDADVIALQETESGEWASKVFGEEYNYYFSTRDYVQRVGVAVKKSSGYGVLFQEYKALGLESSSVRYGVDLTLTKEGKTVRLLAVHLKSGCFELPLDQSSLETISNSRDKKSCSKLATQIEPLEQWIDSRAAEQVPYIVLGDFNRRFAIDIEKSYSETQGLWQAIDDDGLEDLWTPTLTENSMCWGGYYKDYIDHIVFGKQAKEMYIENSFNQLVFDGKYSKALSKSLSDHCPISVKLNF